MIGKPEQLIRRIHFFLQNSSHSSPNPYHAREPPPPYIIMENKNIEMTGGVSQGDYDWDCGVCSSETVEVAASEIVADFAFLVSAASICSSSWLGLSP
jgi:hypothetical protein